MENSTRIALRPQIKFQMQRPSPVDSQMKSISPLRTVWESPEKETYCDENPDDIMQTACELWWTSRLNGHELTPPFIHMSPWKQRLNSDTSPKPKEIQFDEDE